MGYRQTFHNKILFIDLSTLKVESEIVDPDLYDEFIGGAAIGLKIACDFIKPNNDPFSPDNPLIISAGALSGTLAPGTPKISAITKHPAIASEDGKHFIGSSVAGGRFGHMMRNAGYDQIVITGKAEKPVYIKLVDESVEICNASEYWGRKDIYETIDSLSKELENEYSVLSIGKAAENLVRYAMAIVDKTSTLGRSGVGSVLGSKNLKAIAIRGTKGVKVARPREFMNAVYNVHRSIMEWPNREKWQRQGMGAGMATFLYTMYPGKWTRKRWSELYGERIVAKTIEKVIACKSCPIGCRPKWRIKDGEFAGLTDFSSPYAKGAIAGALLDIEDYRMVYNLEAMATQAGLDFFTISKLVDFVTTLYGEGILKKEDTGGMKLERRYDTYAKLIEVTIKREGIGDMLADGWYALYKRLNLNPQDYWFGGICKGVDFIYDARPSKFHPLMMTFFTNPRPHHGGSHTLTNIPQRSLEEIRSQVEKWGIPQNAIERIFTPAPYTGRFNIGRYTKHMEDGMIMNNSLGACSMYSMFGLLTPEDLARFYSALYGIDVTAGQLMSAGEKGFNIKKLLNVREGFSKEDDKVPELWLRPLETPDGNEVTTDYYRQKILTKDDFERLLDDYYNERGWDKETGIPTKEKLQEIGLKKYISFLG